MATYDPNILIVKLKDVSSELDQWTVRSRDFTAIAKQHQLQVAEAAEQMQHTAKVCHSQAQDDVNSVEANSNQLGQLRHDCEETLRKTEETLKDAQNWQTKATDTHKKWDRELAKARAWLAKAEERLANAIAEYNRAQNAVAAARSSLSSAESALSGCRSNKNRNNCWSEENRVSSAQAALRAAEDVLATARVELESAKEEVEAAKKRVACCEKAVEEAMQACSLAEQAIRVANEAIATAERSIDSVHAAERSLSGEAMSSARSASEQALAIAGRFREEMETASRHVTHADEHFRAAERYVEDAQRYAHEARINLEDRVSSLEQLRRMSVRGTSGTGFFERVVTKIKMKITRNMTAVLLPIVVEEILRTHRRRIGEIGEGSARAWAKQKFKGYNVIRGQYNKIHGIDLIALGKNKVIFIEVKSHAKTPTLSTFGQQGSAATIRNRLEKAIEHASTTKRAGQLMRAQTLFNKGSWKSLGLGLGAEKEEMVLFDLKRRKPLR